MTGKRQFIGLAFLVCILLFSGCGELGQSEKAKAPRVDEIGKTPTEQKKAKLLRTIDRRFENPEAHFELGRLYQADGLWVQAEYEYNVALGFNPVHRQAQAAAVKVLANSGNTVKAELLADIYMNQVAGYAESSLRLALAFQGQQLDEYALDCYRQALHLAPNSAKIHRQIGYYYLSRNNKVQAKEYLVRSFQLNPNQPEVSGELGRLGVAVRIPRKTERSTKKLEKIVEQSDKDL